MGKTKEFIKSALEIALRTKAKKTGKDYFQISAERHKRTGKIRALFTFFKRF